MLRGRSGLGFGAIGPLQFQTIESWCRVMGIIDLHPIEAEALIHLDAALEPARDKEPGTEDPVDTPQETKKPEWPTAKKRKPKES